jgi:hypothetical protein
MVLEYVRGDLHGTLCPATEAQVPKNRDSILEVWSSLVADNPMEQNCLRDHRLLWGSNRVKATHIHSIAY